jgi:hypothetical protein
MSLLPARGNRQALTAPRWSPGLTISSRRSVRAYWPDPPRNRSNLAEALNDEANGTRRHE